MAKKPTQTTKQGRIAFITTPKYRESDPGSIENFIYKNLYSLCRAFDVMTTGHTYDFIKKRVGRSLAEFPTGGISLMEKDAQFSIKGDDNLADWKNVILSGLQPTMGSFQGMIYIAFELVEGRLDAIIHLTDWQDKSAKPDSAVLAREANVHDVPIATNVQTAEAYIESWKSLASMHPRSSIFRKRQEPEQPPLRGIRKNARVLAMVAHNNMKLELCRFAVKNADYIFQHYDYILATGTTGGWLKRFMEAIKRNPDEIEKIRCCNSGPLGGDLQIAYAVVKGMCHKIVFLQDPSVSHAHASDIRLFEQATVAEGVHVELATNVESAKLLVFAGTSPNK